MKDRRKVVLVPISTMSSTYIKNTIRSLPMRLMKRFVSANAFLNPQEVRQELNLC